MDPISSLVDQTSRTFALGIRHLPAALARSVSVAYLLLRVSDYFEDNERMDPAAKAAYLTAWAAALESADPSPPAFEGPASFDETMPDARAARSAAAILEAFRALPPSDLAVVARHVAASTMGMARWVARGPDFGDEADLDDYMFEVAGRVGHLLTDLFALRAPALGRRRDALTPLARDFGLGLQTVNVIRGLSTDPSRGWIFVPRAFLPPGVAAADLWRDPGSEPARALLERLVVKAGRHLHAARDFILAVPRREYGIRVFCLLPLLFAVRTLELSRSNPDVYRAEVKLTRGEVLAITRRTRVGAPCNRWILRATRPLALLTRP